MRKEKDNIEKEKFISNYPIQDSIEGTEKILEQMKNCVCKIYKKKEHGTGFFCKIHDKSRENYLYFLVTNNHVLNENDLESGNMVKFSLFNEKVMKKIVISENRKTYTNTDLDVTFIQIKPNDKEIFEKVYYLELDENFCQEEDFFNELYANKPIYILHYPEGKNILVSYGIINEIKNSKIKHLCSTKCGSSGSPILLLEKKTLIGVHYGGNKSSEYNEGTLLKIAISEFFDSLKQSKKRNLNIDNHTKPNNDEFYVKKKILIDNNENDKYNTYTFTPRNTLNNNNNISYNVKNIDNYVEFIDNKANLNKMNINKNLFIRNNNPDLTKNLNINEEKNKMKISLNPNIKRPKINSRNENLNLSEYICKTENNNNEKMQYKSMKNIKGPNSIYPPTEKNLNMNMNKNNINLDCIKNSYLFNNYDNNNLNNNLNINEGKNLKNKKIIKIIKNRNVNLNAEQVIRKTENNNNEKIQYNSTKNIKGPNSVYPPTERKKENNNYLQELTYKPNNYYKRQIENENDLFKRKIRDRNLNTNYGSKSENLDLYSYDNYKYVNNYN